MKLLGGMPIYCAILKEGGLPVTLFFMSASFLAGGDEDDPVGSANAVDRGGGGILQNFDALDHSGGYLAYVPDFDSVHEDERFGAAVYGVAPADGDARTAYLHPRNAAPDVVVDVGVSLGTLHIQTRDGTGVILFLDVTVAGVEKLIVLTAGGRPVRCHFSARPAGECKRGKSRKNQ